MYTAFQSDGKQYQVNEGQTVRLGKLDVATGRAAEFAEVPVIADGEEIKIDIPFVEGGVIKTEIVTHGRGEKIKIVKLRRHKRYHRQRGHCQWFTNMKATGISA